MRRWAGFALAALLAVAASAPLWLKLPVPRDTLVLAEATYTAQDGVPARVTLPHAQGRHRARGRYQLAFDLERPVEQPLYLFIPLVNYRALIALDGQAVLDTSVASMSIPGITLGVSALAPLPGRLAARLEEARAHADETMVLARDEFFVVAAQEFELAEAAVDDVIDDLTAYGVDCTPTGDGG